MSEEVYTRPNIERALIVNPERESVGNITEAEAEIDRIAKQRIPQVRGQFRIEHYQYDAPFFYPNFRVELGRPWENASNNSRADVPDEIWGITTDELKPDYVGAEINADGVELDVPPYGAITFVEYEPIVEVTVIGSSCVPPGYIMIYGEPVEWKYWRTGIKMKVDNLWGEHLRWHLWCNGINEGYRDAGMSCAVFRIPPCKKITIMAGSQHTLDAQDMNNMRHDAHYAVRCIYVGVQKPSGEDR
jgi:hypothetical protein